MDEASLASLAPSAASSCGGGCSGLDGGLAMAGSVLRTASRSPSFAAPNQDGASPDPSFCEARRTGVELTARLWALRCGCRPTCLGSAGTGGASSSSSRRPRDWLLRRPEAELAGRCGLGVRKVRSAIELLLPGRRRAEGPWPGSDAEAAEAADALRRTDRFVCTSATRVGVIGRERRAAAAAAAEREAFESWRLKTAAAAVVALGLAVAAVSGCWGEGARHGTSASFIPSLVRSSIHHRVAAGQGGPAADGHASCKSDQGRDGTESE